MKSKKIKMNIPEDTVTPIGKECQSPEKLLGKKLLIGAVVLWLVSLVLPAFVVAGKMEVMPGISVMLGGLIFGWWVFGWAAYANIFFAYTVVCLSRRESSPKAVACMVFLALTIFWFKGVITSEASGVATPVVSWGWGAVTWFVSLAVLALASLANDGSIGRFTAKVGLVPIFVSVLVVALFGISQRERANLQESEQYLPLGVAFTTAKFSGVPLTWPEHALVPVNEAVAFDVSDVLTNPVSGAPHLWLPPAKVVLQHGVYWTVFKSGQGEEIKVRRLGEPPKFLLAAKATESGATIQLSDLKSGTILYAQKLVSRSNSVGGRMFLPSGHSWFGGTYGVVPALNRVLGIDSTYSPLPQLIKSETARLPCNVQAKPADIPSLVTWAGKDVLIKPTFYQSSVAFCSINYVVMIKFRSPVPTSTESRSVSVFLFDRETLAPIARFFNKSKCATGCPVDETIVVTGARISDNAVVVETDLGDFVASLRSD